MSPERGRQNLGEGFECPCRLWEPQKVPEENKMGIDPVEESRGEAGKQGVAYLALGVGGMFPTPGAQCRSAQGSGNCY